MDTVFAERPHFFEGQYLGAEDLQTLLSYLREQAERQRLASHTWGVNTGIDLAFRAASDGSTEYFLTPGVAGDGYGRLIAVLAPYKLDASLFATQPTGLVNVWLRYVEASAGGVRPGFEVCDSVDAFARVSESFAIEVGLRNTLSQRQSGVEVNDTNFTDAREALGQYLPNQPIALDGSVAAQLFPNDTDPSRWLIPVGRVPWTQGTPGSFGAADETAQKQSLLFRQQAGLVTESIIAGNGLLRLRTRWVERVAGKSNDELAQSIALAAKDLQTCHGRIEPTEPIWIEAATRLTGDLRVFGRRVEWQDASGTDYANGGIPLAVRRRADTNPVKGVDLQVMLGKAVNGPNRLVIGQATLQAAPSDPCQLDFDFADRVMIQDDGKVGLGTEATTLTTPLTIRTTGSTGDAVALQAGSGKIAWQINFGATASGLNFTQSDPAQSNFFLANTGNVGIGIATPDAKLDIRQVAAPNGGNALGAGKWLQTGDGGDGGRAWIQYGSQLAPLLVLSGSVNPPRLQFQQTGGGTEPGPQFQSWVGHARGGSSDIAISGGYVGIGTLQPQRVLHVESTEIHTGGGGAGFSFANRNTGAFVEGPANGERWVWYARDNDARLWSGDDKLSVTPLGNMGVGTLSPVEKLEVRGNIKLGAGDNYFALGSPDNVRMLAGQVPISGGGAGNGWTANHVGSSDSGHYHVNFATPFLTTPVVTVTLVDPLAQDNTICVAAVTAAGFDVYSRDIDPSSSGGTTTQDSAFNFIAVGPRP